MSSGGGFDILHAAHDRGIFVDYKPFMYCFIAANVAFLTIAPLQTLHNYEFLILLSPIWIPLLLARFAILRWITANRFAAMARQEFVLLELRMPRDIRKTPLAMEAVFTSLHLWPGESNWWKRVVRGQTRPHWAFEIVSLGGRVHFYIWTRAALRRGLESYFYAQYPEIEIVEATDYSRVIDPAHEPYDLWGTEYRFSKDEDVYPIRTYQEFMRPDSTLAKPEEQVDPLAQIIELIGGIGPKEQFWIQILVRATKGEKFWGKKTADGKQYTFKDQAKEVLEKLRQQTVRKETRVDATGATYETESFPNPTRGVQATMEAVEKKVSKPLFDVGLRALYTAPKDAYQGIMVAHMIGLWRGFVSETLNGFAITRWFTNFDDWPWEDTKGIHKAHVSHGLIDSYRRRSYFTEPYRMPWMLMNAEELASLYHVPSSGITTPSLPRIQSATSEAPSNLPT
jgi:hypothetical protein